MHWDLGFVSPPYPRFPFVLGSSWGCIALGCLIGIGGRIRLRAIFIRHLFLPFLNLGLG